VKPAAAVSSTALSLAASDADDATSSPNRRPRRSLMMIVFSSTTRRTVQVPTRLTTPLHPWVILGSEERQPLMNADIPLSTGPPAVARRLAQCRMSWLHVISDRFQCMAITGRAKSGTAEIHPMPDLGAWRVE
jgi:hypothetical protein